VLFEHSGFEQKGALTGADYGWKAMHAKLAEMLVRQRSLR
jgi:hypothetical protein